MNKSEIKKLMQEEDRNPSCLVINEDKKLFPKTTKPFTGIPYEKDIFGNPPGTKYCIFDNHN